MTVETASFISQLDATYPASGDAKSEGDNHLRLIKAAVKGSFPGLTAAAVTATSAELNHVVGVTSAIQTQIGTKAPIASPTFTGTVTIPSGASIAGFAPLASPTFTGTVTLPATGSGSTEAVRKDYADGLVFAAVLPAQTGNAGKFVTTDGTNASWQTPSVFATGTAMLFAQTAAPTGWTKSTTHDNKALRVVSGTAGSGGSTAFTTVFASRTPAGSVTVGATTLTESQIPAHAHATTAYNSSITGSFDNAGGVSAITSLSSAGITSTSTGGGASHTHTGSFTGTAMDFAVQYVDVIIATKD